MKNFGPYQHPYGGTAIDVYVSRAKFAKTFGLSQSSLDSLPVRMKVADKTVDIHTEICGYVILGPRGKKHFLLTTISYK